MPVTSRPCPIHSKYQCEAITSEASPQNNQVFKCWKCITSENVNTQSLITVQEIIEAADEKTVLEKWPPLNDQEVILQKVTQILNETDPKYPKKEICSKIERYFQELEKQIKENIESHKQHMLYLAQVYCDTNITVRTIYEDMAQLDTFKSLIVNSSDEYSQGRLVEFIQQKHLATQYNTDKISLAVKQHEELSCLFDFDKPAEIQLRIIDQIKQINFFILDSEEDVHDYQSTITPSSQFSSTLEDRLIEETHPTIDMIMSLVSNKFNFCNDLFLRELRQKMFKLKTYFARIPLDNVFLDGRQPQTFENFSIQQLDEFAQIGNLIAHGNAATLSGSDEGLSSSPSSSSDNLPMTSSSPSSKSPQGRPSLVNNLQKLLRMSQINELLKTQEDRAMKLTFQKTEFKDSHCACLVGVDEKRNAVFKQVAQGYSSAYLNVPIMNELKYVMRIKLASKNNNFHFFCGLVPTQIKDIQYMHQQQVIFTQKDERTEVEKTKGNYLSLNGVRQKYKEFEIHFCIAESVFVYADYPNYENINTIPAYKFKHFNLKENFVFAFELYYPSDKFVVTNLQITEQFPTMQQIQIPK